MERVVGRLVHPASGRSYHEKFAPPKVAGVFPGRSAVGDAVTFSQESEPEWLNEGGLKMKWHMMVDERSDSGTLAPYLYGQRRLLRDVTEL